MFYNENFDPEHTFCNHGIPFDQCNDCDEPILPIDNNELDGIDAILEGENYERELERKIFDQS